MMATLHASENCHRMALVFTGPYKKFKMHHFTKNKLLTFCKFAEISLVIVLDI